MYTSVSMVEHDKRVDICSKYIMIRVFCLCCGMHRLVCFFENRPVSEMGVR